MKHYALALILALCLISTNIPALAQSNITAGTPPGPVTSANPFPVSIAGSSGTSATNITQVNGTAVSAATNPLPVVNGSTTIANSTNVTGNLATTTSTTVTLGAAARNLSVRNCDTTAIVYVDIKSGTASTTNGVRLDPGVAYSWLGLTAPITTFTYYSTAPNTTNTLTYTAY